MNHDKAGLSMLEIAILQIGSLLHKPQVVGFDLTSITRRRVVAMDQSLLSSRHKMMNSFCCILALTMPSTCLELACS